MAANSFPALKLIPTLCNLKPGFLKSSFIIIALTCLLSACSTSTPIDQAPSYSWTERVQLLKQQNSWQINGKIGIRHPQDNIAANISWDHHPDSYHVYMAGPLGQGAINIRGTQSGVMLETSDGDNLTAATPEALLQERLGWSLPIQQLLYWIKGIPAPDNPYRKQLDSANRLISLDQNQWQISYPSYQYVADLDLPRKIVMRYGEDIRVTFIIKEWQLANSPL